MAGKPWYMKLEVSKVMADGGLAICSLAARGAWMWLLMRMHADGATGVWEGTPRQFAALIGAVDEPVDDLLTELRAARVGEFEDLGDGRLRIVSRRMRREAELRAKDRNRKADVHPISEPIPEQFQTISDPFSDYDYDSVSKPPVLEGGAGGRGRPSSVDEVWQYATMVHLPDHAAEFFDHFEAAGWRMGNGTGRPMRDWQAAYRNWCRRAPQFERKNGSTNGTQPLSARQYAGLSVREKLERGGFINPS